MRAGRVDLEFGRQRLDGAPPILLALVRLAELVAVAGLPVVLRVVRHGRGVQVTDSPGRGLGAVGLGEAVGRRPLVLPSDDVRKSWSAIAASVCRTARRPQAHRPPVAPAPARPSRARSLPPDAAQAGQDHQRPKWPCRLNGFATSLRRCQPMHTRRSSACSACGRLGSALVAGIRLNPIPRRTQALRGSREVHRLVARHVVLVHVADVGDVDSFSSLCGPLLVDVPADQQAGIQRPQRPAGAWSPTFTGSELRGDEVSRAVGGPWEIRMSRSLGMLSRAGLEELLAAVERHRGRPGTTACRGS